MIIQIIMLINLKVKKNGEAGNSGVGWGKGTQNTRQ